MNSRHQLVMELLENHGPSLHALLARLTLCEHTTGDLMQELFIKLSSIKDLQRVTYPAAYAWRVAVNLAFDWRRRRKKLQPLDEQTLPAENCRSTLNEMIQREELDQVLDAVGKLNNLARDVVVLRFIEQRSYEDIARILGKKPQYLRALCSKALAGVRVIINKQDDASDITRQNCEKN